MTNDKYLFIKLDESGVDAKLTDNLEDFESFCHYSGLSDWSEHKKLIKKCLQTANQYIFTGNDVWYYVLSHPTWEFISSSELTIKVRGEN